MPSTPHPKLTTQATVAPTAVRSTTPRSKLTRRQIYALVGLAVALVLFMAFVIPVTVDAVQHNTVFTNAYRSTARHGYSSEILGTVPRQIPTTLSDSGLVADGTIPYYPTYGSTAAYDTDQKNAVIRESVALYSAYVSGDATTKYSYFDRDGYQRLLDGSFVDDGHGGKARLYAHTASQSMYFQDGNTVPYISDQEPAVVKRMTFAPRSTNNYGNRGYSVTGLYAAPGELVTVCVSGADLRAAGGELTFHIGQCLYNGQSNNIWAAKGVNRMPNILNTLKLNATTAEYDAERDVYTAYLGSYLGGPIYLRHTAATVALVFAGALEYRHFVLGYTTADEYARLCHTTTPYFDLEIWDNGILHSGSVRYAQKYDYDAIYAAAVLWEKITLTSTQVRKQGVVMIYDPFVAAGAAVAFPGRSSTNCPASWLDSALNATAFEKTGAWGVMHEYNHNFQGGWELAGGGEVSNNALNLASYVAYTKISSARRLSTLNTDTGLSGWNAYTNASWALKNTLTENWPNQLVVYATLLHGIGAKNFVTGVGQCKGGNADGLYQEMSAVTGYNFDYFFNQIVGQVPTVSVNADAPAFVPVASIYQTGRSILNADGATAYIKTMQPYEFAYGDTLTVDLRRYDGGQTGTVVLPAGITFDITHVTQPRYGTLTETDTKGVYTYVPDPDELSSGQIKVTLTLHADASLGDYAAAIEGQTVDLVLELQQSHEMNRTMLQRTVYRYDGSGMSDPLKTLYGNDPVNAFTSNFAGHSSTATANNVNTTENSNTDIWLTADEYNQYGANTILVVSGKIYVAEAGEYRLTLRGRVHAAVVISLDGGKTYDQSLTVENRNGSPTLTDTTLTASLDLPNLPAGQWVYFQEILFLNEKVSGNRYPFIGLGWGKIEHNAIAIDDETTDETAAYEESTQVTLNYASAYRATYQFATQPYVSEYLFRREWQSTYDPSVQYNNRGKLLSYSGFTPWDDTVTIHNLFDADNTNAMHSQKGAAYDITPDQPFDMTVDLGALYSVNTLTIYGRTKFTTDRNSLPRNFTLYGGYTRNKMQVLVTHTDADDDWRVDNDLVIKFHTTTLRYYRLVVHDTYQTTTGARYICFRYLQFDARQDTLTKGTHLVPDDDNITYRGTWRVVNATSTFGRVYVGKAQDKVEFQFTGTRFGIYTNLYLSNGNFDVYIDGKKIETAVPQDGKTVNDYTAMGYLSDWLRDGTHTVKLVGRANFNLDSVIYW
ncbi:MAG: M60 family metallopeptidase [Prevotella sp.]|nr:M60 family metallopeptidase [Prevotella sp.]